jgi:hypothetical protein
MMPATNTHSRSICAARWLSAAVLILYGGSAQAEDDEASSGTASPSVQSAPPLENQPPLPAALAVGTGLGQRFVRLPTRSGEQRLDTGFFPTLDLLLTGEFGVGTHALVGAQAHYQTSVGSTVRSTPPAGVSRETSLRTHHVDLGMTAGLRFSEANTSVSARLFVGWAFRGLRSVVDTDIPPYSMHGLVLRPELRVPVAHGAVTFHLAPELFVIAHLTDELRHVGATAAAGLAFGGEVAMDVRLSERVDLTLSYRESRASVSSSWSALTDNERFATAGVALRY